MELQTEETTVVGGPSVDPLDVRVESNYRCNECGEVVSKKGIYSHLSNRHHRSAIKGTTHHETNLPTTRPKKKRKKETGPRKKKKIIIEPGKEIDVPVVLRIKIPIINVDIIG
jgi:hypothetical protein|tara:strand:- start:143 stop:481 length:339 start_codon:yes stop_codon:yes gene_type:complete